MKNHLPLTMEGLRKSAQLYGITMLFPMSDKKMITPFTLWPLDQDMLQESELEKQERHKRKRELQKPWLEAHVTSKVMDGLVNKASNHTVDKLTSCDKSPEPGTVLQDLSWLTKPSLLEDVFAPTLSTDNPLSEEQHSDSSDSAEYPDPPDDEAMLDFLRHLCAVIRKYFKADPPEAPFRPGPVKWGG